MFGGNRLIPGRDMFSVAGSACREPGWAVGRNESRLRGHPVRTPDGQGATFPGFVLPPGKMNGTSNCCGRDRCCRPCLPDTLDEDSNLATQRGFNGRQPAIHAHTKRWASQKRPRAAPRYCEAFSLEPERCFRLSPYGGRDWTRPALPMHHRVGGRYQDRAGRWHTVESCDGRRVDLDSVHMDLPIGPKSPHRVALEPLLWVRCGEPQLLPGRSSEISPK
jgi:hypothetical protein